jgi:hypothetical protein
VGVAGGARAAGRARGPRLRRARWTLVGAGAYELAYITLQAARGEASHFNTGDPLHAVLYGLMGVGAVALIATNVPLALAVARRPAPDADPELRRAAVSASRSACCWAGCSAGT